jgi:cell division protein ZapA
MTDQTKPIAISILDKEYVLACAETERESLFESVAFLNSRMREVRESGKIVGSERVAILAALNIAHEYLAYKQQKEDYTVSIDASVRRIQDKIADALSHGQRGDT